jgi:tRNA A37 threonylcarbamoyladenosine biosynthesis protein TsaE
VYHIDLYRLGHGVESRESRCLTGVAEAIVEIRMTNEETENLGLDSYLDGDGVCLVEWAERAENALPDATIRVRMSVEGQCRRIEIAGLRAALEPGQ